MKRKPTSLVLLIYPLCIVVILACGIGEVALPTATTESMPTVRAEELWIRLEGNIKADQSWAVVTDDESNLYWGTFQQAPGELFSDLVIYKYAPDGSLLWETRYGSPYQEKLFVLAVSPPYLLVGGEQDHSFDISQSDMLILALDLQDGSLIWETIYDQGFGYEEVDGLVAEGGFIYVSGWTTSENNGNDVGILKLDLQGKIIWSRSWGGPGWDQADGQMVVDEDHLYISGRYNGNDYLSGGHGLLACFSKESGENLRHAVWNSEQFYDGYGMTSDGTFLYVTGITIVPRSGMLGNGQIFVQKWDKQLNLIWEEQWGGSGGDQARAIGVNEEGRIIVAGNATISGNKQIVLLVYDGDGNLLGETLWGGVGEDVAHGLWISGEYVYIAGETRSAGAGMNDALLLKVHIPTGTFPQLP